MCQILLTILQFIDHFSRIKNQEKSIMIFSSDFEIEYHESQLWVVLILLMQISKSQYLTFKAYPK